MPEHAGSGPRWRHSYVWTRKEASKWYWWICMTKDWQSTARQLRKVSLRVREVLIHPSNTTIYYIKLLETWFILKIHSDTHTKLGILHPAIPLCHSTIIYVDFIKYSWYFMGTYEIPRNTGISIKCSTGWLLCGIENEQARYLRFLWKSCSLFQKYENRDRSPPPPPRLIGYIYCLS